MIFPPDVLVRCNGIVIHLCKKSFRLITLQLATLIKFTYLAFRPKDFITNHKKILIDTVSLSTFLRIEKEEEEKSSR